MPHFTHYLVSRLMCLYPPSHVTVPHFGSHCTLLCLRSAYESYLLVGRIHLMFHTVVPFDVTIVLI